MMNLKETRKSLGLTQAEFGKMLCMSWRNYHRCEEANKLQPQAQKILKLMLLLKRVYGFINTEVNCLGFEFKENYHVSISIDNICEIGKDVKEVIEADLK